MDIKKIIKDSKKRCVAFGLDPISIPNFSHRLSPQELIKMKNKFSPVLDAIHAISNNIMDPIADIPFAMLYTDNEGYLLGVFGDHSFDGLMKQLNVSIGAKFFEEESGTNCVSLALMHKQPICLIGKDHFHTFLHPAACYAVPLTDRQNGSILGTLGLMTDKRNQNPLFLSLLNVLTKMLEREISIHKMWM